MAHFLVWSDLHDEHWKGFDLPDLPMLVDGVLIAGDTNVGGRHLDIPAEAAIKYQCPVVVIWGNHELYGSAWPDLIADEQRQLADLHAEGLDIRVLHGAATEIAGVRIVGATLWTDLQLYPGFVYLARVVVEARMNDFRVIRTARNKTFTVNDMLERHKQDKAALLGALRTPHEGSTVVMTHHIPVRDLIAPRHNVGGEHDRALNNGFACDLWNEIKIFDIDTWICGHSHETQSLTIEGDRGPIRFVMNQRGYPGDKIRFDPRLIVSV